MLLIRELFESMSKGTLNYCAFLGEEFRQFLVFRVILLSGYIFYENIMRRLNVMEEEECHQNHQWFNTLISFHVQGIKKKQAGAQLCQAQVQLG